ncbi:MAG TPA: MarR family transcriptional regulator, partial [Microbacterium sp.]|nr:MarR family transcriptional regulator [Microbacterium sp.]
MDIFERVVRLETTLWDLVERSLSSEGEAGLGTFFALQILHRHDGAGRVQDLSRELSITIGAASKVVDRLERAGLAVRRPHPDDRRSSWVSLTDEGEHARAAADVVVQRVSAAVFSDAGMVAAAATVLDSLQ